MPNPALDALKRLSTQTYRPEIDSSQSDPSVQRYNLQNDLRDDTEDQIINQTKARGYAAASSRPQEAQAYNGNIDAFTKLLGRTNADLEENPLTKQMDEVNDYHKQERNAILGGFTGGLNAKGEGMNPIQQSADYGRQFETAKLNAPIEQQRVQSEGELEKQRVASQGNLEVANSKAAIQEAQLNAAIASGRTIKSFTPSGGFSFETTRPPQQVNAGLLRDITNTRAAMKQKGAKNSFLGIPYGESPEHVAYKGALGAAYAQHPGAPELKELAQMISENPNLDGYSTDAVLQKLHQDGSVDISDMTPEEKDQLDELLFIGRGAHAN